MRLFYLGCLLATSAASAQHLVDFSKVPPVEVPAGLHIDSVIATFSDSASIGIVYRGANNRPEPAFLPGGVATTMEGLLRNGPATDTTVHCTMRINALAIKEAGNVRYCGLNVELLTRMDSGWVRIFSHAGTTKLRGGADATQNRARSIANGFAEVMAKFTEARSQGRLTAQQLIHPPKAGVVDEVQQPYPVLLAGAPAQGVYPNFQDFLDQRPDTSCAFSLKPVGVDPMVPMVKLKNERDCPIPDEPWGVSDGQHVYINVGNRFLWLNRTGNQFVSRYPVNTETVDAGLLFTSMAFGLLGGVVYLAASPPNKPIPVKLDLLTGSLKDQVQRDPGMTADPRSSEHLFLYDRHCAMDTTVEMLVYGGMEAKLRKNQYHRLKLVPRVEKVPVLVRVGDGKQTLIEISTGKVGGDPLVYLITVGKDGNPAVDQLNDYMTGSILKKLDRFTEVN